MDANKLKIVPAHLSELSNVVYSDVVKKTVYDKLVLKVSAIDTKIPSTSGLVSKTQCESHKQEDWRCWQKVTLY